MLKYAHWQLRRLDFLEFDSSRTRFDWIEEDECFQLLQANSWYFGLCDEVALQLETLLKDAARNLAFWPSLRRHFHHHISVNLPGYLVQGLRMLAGGVLVDLELGRKPSVWDLSDLCEEMQRITGSHTLKPKSWEETVPFQQMCEWTVKLLQRWNYLWWVIEGGMLPAQFCTDR